MENLEHTNKKYSLQKKNILRSRTLIMELFNNSSSFFIYPFKVYYSSLPPGQDIQVLFTVPRRNFKKAVDRNLMRRRIKEAFRQNKDVLLERIQDKVSFSFAIIYISKDLGAFKDIETSMANVLKKLGSIAQYTK